MKPYPLYETARLGTLRELVDYAARRHGEAVAFAYMSKKQLVTVSYSRFARDVKRLSAWIRALGSCTGHIAILGENSYCWIVTYLAVTYGAQTVVPLDKDMPENEIPLRLADSDSDTVLLSDTYKDYADSCIAAGARVVLFSEVNALLTTEPDADTDSDTLPVPEPDTLASIVFTSGTTGSPKGVMLTHGNFASDLWGACSNVHLAGSGLLLLPLHHTFGLVAGLLACVYYGRTLYINLSLRNIASDLKTFKPQHIFAVPLIVEALYRNIWTGAKKQKKDRLLKVLLKLSKGLYRLRIDVRRKLFSSVLTGLGGELSLLVSGGAPIEQKYLDFFDAIGVTILNGYGITECAPVVAVNRNAFRIPGSVGTILPCNEVRIASDGEICVRGENVMQGYYKNEAATRESLTDGWFMTGDLGRLDEHNALFITGRKKNLIILSNGENISAEELESLILEKLDYVREVVVSATDAGIGAECYLDPEKPEAKGLIDEGISGINRTLVPNKRIANITLRDTEFPKTTTKKIIREKR